MINIADLELRHLLTFKEVATRRSFGQAADALGFTQSAVSQQIARLELVVGESLFYRPGGPKPVELTVAGELLLSRVDGVIGRLREIAHDFEGLAGGMRGRLSVGCFQSVSVALLPLVLGRLKEERPELDIELFEASKGEVLTGALLNRELDVAFGLETDLVAGLTMVRLIEDHFVLVAPAGTPASQATFPNLIGKPMIGQHDDDSCQRRIDAGLRARGVEPRYVFRSGDNSAVQAMVRAAQGVAVMPTLAVDRSDPGVEVFPLDPPLPPRIIVLLTRADEKPSPAVQRFIELAQEQATALLSRV